MAEEDLASVRGGRAPVPAPGSGWVVGLNHGGHDASCALLHDGELVICIEQERLSRHKRAVEESPADALRYCLDFAGIKLEDVDVVALGSDHDRLAEWLRLDAEGRARVLPYDQPDWLFPERLFAGQRPRTVEPVAHHIAHAASAFWPSGFDDAAVLVFDAMGEDSATSVAVGSAGGLKIVRSYPVDTSLGFYYEAASEFAGLSRHDGGKLMGLASYGRAKYPTALRYDAANDDIRWEGVPPATRFGRDLINERGEALLRYFERECYPYTRRQDDDIMAYADFAASAQTALEETILDIAARVREETGLRRLALAGGVALNCTANGKLARSGIFDEVYVQPMAHDAGVALGAALVAAQSRGSDLAGSRMEHAYWGPLADEEEIRTELAAAGLSARRLPQESLLPRVAEIIANGGIVAWHQGRAEVGPRALGARSLLGDPRTRKTLVRLNTAKDREMWRPLAPSVPYERFHDYFEGVPNAFMIVAAQVRPEWRTRLPAVTHVDGSARPQAVRRADSPRYHDLLLAFERHTGTPVLVNTSLNVAEQPMACLARDSIDVFDRAGADALVLGEHLVVR